MDINLRKIDRSNYQECIDLKVAQSQVRYVAPNMFSLVQAAYEPDMCPLGVYNKGKMIGFILYDFDRDLNGWSMSRFMIDEKYQNSGFGKRALEVFLDYFKENHKSDEIYTSAETDNNVAISLYENFGFKNIGKFEYESGGNKYVEYRMLLRF